MLQWWSPGSQHLALVSTGSSALPRALVTPGASKPCELLLQYFVELPPYMHSKKGFGLLRTLQKWVYWWASNYASPGLTVLRRRIPGPPAPAQAGTRGAITCMCCGTAAGSAGHEGACPKHMHASSQHMHASTLDDEQRVSSRYSSSIIISTSHMKCGRLQDTLIHNEALQDKSQATSAVSASFVAAFLPHDPSGRVRHEGPMASSCQAREAVCGQRHMHLTVHAATPEGLHTPSLQCGSLWRSEYRNWPENNKNIPVRRIP